MRELKISTSWVRGVVGDALTPELVVRFACAFGTWCDGGPVVIARDTRRSSDMFRAATVAGLMSTGCEVVDLGVSPTPLVSFAVRELGCAGGISITGSHNDSEWNALKFIGPDGALLNAVRGEELLDIYHASVFRAVPLTRAPVTASAPDIAARYVGHLTTAMDIGRVRARGFRVAVDFCNGTCADSARAFLRELGCGLVPVNAEPSGVFAHSPAPTPANLGQLSAAVKESAVDLGAALNIDGDRAAFVAADGTALSEEFTLPLACLNRLGRRPGPIVATLSTSRMIDGLASSYDQRVIRTCVGESFVVDRGIEEGAVLAGEGSGGVAPLPFTMTFDGLLTLGMVLETLAVTGSSLAELAAGLPRWPIRKGHLPCRPEQAYRALEAFRKTYDGLSPDYTDGVRVEWPDGWLHVRVSTTEPMLRIVAEGQEERRADEIFSEALKLASDAAAV